jgi:hypothetical protein
MVDECLQTDHGPPPVDGPVGRRRPRVQPGRSVLMTGEHNELVIARHAEAARLAAEGGCACSPDGSPFGAGHY